MVISYHAALREGCRTDEALDAVIIGVALTAATVRAFVAPFPGIGGNPVLDLIAYHDPGLHTVIYVWYYAAPGIALLLAGSVCLSVSRVWLEPRTRRGARGKLPAWPTSASDEAPSLVIGETAPSDGAARGRAAVVARHPGEGALHRRPRRRGRRHRQDHRLHVSVRPAEYGWRESRQDIAEIC